jgi:acetyl-CoA acyltransferase
MRAMEVCPDVYTPMGITAENVAKKFGVTREEQDAFALASQKKAAAAIEGHKFDEEIVAVKAVKFDGDKHVDFDFTRDELVRPDTTKEGLASLKPVFAATGTVTAGNASPLSDGAAAAIVMSEDKAKALGLAPLATFRAFATVGVDPAIMGIGPVPAVRKLLALTKLSLADIDLVEMNEAFASQSVYCARELGIPAEKLNVNGGAIALGHPLGCTGAKLVATAAHELRRRKQKRAIVTMCIGGGMGAAGLLERD